MARKIKVKLILQLRDQGMSRKEIARTRKMSMTSVCEVFDIADERKIVYGDVATSEDDEAYRLFYPDKHLQQSAFGEPDWDYIHKECARIGVTLKLLHKEYRDKCINSGTIPMGYTRFCEGYSTFTIKNRLTKNFEHKAAERCEVDWAGPKMQIIDEFSGEVIKVCLFVGVLPFSQYAYVEPTLDMKQRSWLWCHVHMYAFFGGVPIRTVCDNLKTGVIKHPREGEIVLNDAYEALGGHYMTAIMPAPVRKPKAKASAEGTVRDITTHIIARLRNVVFTSFDDLKVAVAKELGAYNAHPFQKREGSRKEIFSAVEAPSLRPLPDIPYDVCEWVYNRSVNLNCHVLYRKNHYSAPDRYVGTKVDLRVGTTTIEIYHTSERIATHRLFPPYVTNRYSTEDAHMPDHFSKPDWDDIRIKGWAKQIGVHASAVILRIFDATMIKEQAYNPALAVLRLSKAYGTEAFEDACALALDKFATPRYRQVKAMLDHKVEISDDPQENENTGSAHMRGADYYE